MYNTFLLALAVKEISFGFFLSFFQLKDSIWLRIEKGSIGDKTE